MSMRVSGIIGATALWAGLAGPVFARGLDCVASERCRTDGGGCAASRLSIEVSPTGAAKARLWIDRQGPYPARIARNGGITRITLENFGGSHGMDLHADGGFLYRGNGAKEFTGTCEGEL